MNSIQKIESAVYAIRPELLEPTISPEIYKRVPITLQDILLAMEANMKNKDVFFVGEVFAMNIQGYFVDFHKNILCKYNLRLSPYDQSEDVKDFIANNIK